jgi:low affinity Fe/Cu permease
MPDKQITIGDRFEMLSEAVTRKTGTTVAFIVALGTIGVWASLGPIFDYSDTWQLGINTGTTIVTFLMVFLIQRAHNKDSLAIHLKLNELVAAVQGASNRLIDVEALSEHDLAVLEQHFQELSKLACRDADIRDSHSIEEAGARHQAKRGTSK